jgi:hypothetical protein
MSSMAEIELLAAVSLVDLSEASMRLVRSFRPRLFPIVVLAAWCVVSFVVFADGIGHARHVVVGPNGLIYVNTWSGDYYNFDKRMKAAFW